MAALIEGYVTPSLGRWCVCVCHTSGVGMAGASCEECDRRRHRAVNGVSPSLALLLSGAVQLLRSVTPSGLKG